MYNVSHASGGNPGSGGTMAGAGATGRASPIVTSPEASTGGGTGVESVTPSKALDAEATAVDSSDILARLEWNSSLPVAFLKRKPTPRIKASCNNP